MFSILTPTYNTGHLLHRAYDSLLAQSFKEFEWIIVDDGSTDNTEVLVNSWQKTSNFDIIYYKISINQGKANAVNTGIDICTQPITLIADGDDTFASNTLSDLKIIWDGIDLTENGRKIGAVWTIVQDEEGKLIGEPWPKNFWQVGFKERVLKRKKNVAGEKWHSWRTPVLKKYKKYTNPNSRVSPSVSWNRINKDYDFLCANIIHRTYFSNPQGLTHQKKSKLKVMKRTYYSAYYELESANLLQILSANYYRNMAFSYFRSRLTYQDNETKLSGLKLFVIFSIFLFSLPLKLIKKT